MKFTFIKIKIQIIEINKENEKMDNNSTKNAAAKVDNVQTSNNKYQTKNKKANVKK